MLPKILDPSPPDQEIASVTADGAFSTLWSYNLARWSGYHRGNRVKTKMHCAKLLGHRLMARDFDRQDAEFQHRAAVLNGFITLGISVTKVAG